MTKRVLIASITGAILGIFCWLSAVQGGLLENPSSLRIANIIAHRALMGFVIGISALRMKWAVHGIVVGSVVGAIFILFDAYAGIPAIILFAGLIPINAVYGLIIEFVTTKLFKAAQV